MAYSYNYQLSPNENLRLLDEEIARQRGEAASIYANEQGQGGGAGNYAADLLGQGAGKYTSNYLLGGGSSAAAPATGGAFAGGTALAGTEGISAVAPAFSYGASAAPVAGFNAAGAVPAGLTQAGGFTGVNAGAGSSAGLGATMAWAAPVAAVAINTARTLQAQKKKGTLTDKEINKIWDPVGAATYDKIPFLRKLNLGYKIQSKLWGDNKYAKEYRRADSLRQNGVNWQWNTDKPKKGRSIDELIANAEASGGNVDFAKTRDESKLRPEDTAGYAIWGEKYGNDYANAGLQKQLAVNKLALDAKALNEAKGTINANKNFSSELDKLIRETLQKPEEVKKK